MAKCEPVKCPKPEVRHPYCRVRTITHTPGPSMTQQNHFDQTDVNAIVARFERTGVLPPGRQNGQYGDVTHLQRDLTELINAARTTHQTFEEFQASWIPQPQEPEPTTKPEPTQDPPSTPAA